MGRGLVIDCLVKSREFCAMDTNMTSTFEHTIEKKINNSQIEGHLYWCYELTNNFNNLIWILLILNDIFIFEV